MAMSNQQATDSPHEAAPAPRRTGRLWSRLHFLMRFAGLTGLLAALAGLVVAGVYGLVRDDWAGTWQAVRDALQGSNAGGLTAVCLVLGGTLVGLLALLVEAIVIVRLAAGRRSAVGVNAVFQMILAATLLVGVNAWSFRHYLRLDWTRSEQFTLGPEVRDGLARLRKDSPTTIVVYQRHKTFGTLTDKPDRYDYAAERKVVEKVKDLAEQLREVGPQLQVEVLDVEEDGYDDRLVRLTKDAPELKHAIETAPENSLFFHTRDAAGKERVQRLSFNDFYLLDKTASQADRGGRGNLVLRSQGVGPFARRILSLEERRPRIGIAVIHDVLTTAGQGDLSLQGLGDALRRNGFEVQDIVLKKWNRLGPPTAAAYTVEESVVDRLDVREETYKKNLASLQNARSEIEAAHAIWKKATEDEKTRDELAARLARQGIRVPGGKVTVELAREQLALLEDDLQTLAEATRAYEERLNNVRQEKDKLNPEAVHERRRMTDVKAKLDHLLADCDLLIVPRLTLRNTANPFDNIPATVYRLDDPQVDALKDFLKAGKPMLACFGPSNLPPEAAPRPGQEGPDGLEKLLGELGIKFGKQTVLFDKDVEGFADRRGGLEIAGTTIEVPPVQFEWRRGAGRPVGYPVLSDGPNHIREGLRLAANSLGKGRDLDIRIRHPRPVYYEPPKGVRPTFDPDFLMTSPDSWNEDQPFPTDDSIPQYDRPKGRDAERKPPEASADPLEARRRGPFPIGIAVETSLPPAWYGSAAEPRATVRLAAIGQGGFFTGKELPPAQEKLFVTTIDWLLGRDDRLPTAEQVWSYPRVPLAPQGRDEPPTREELLWRWGMRYGLPALFAYLGVVVLLLRRLR